MPVEAALEAEAQPTIQSQNRYSLVIASSNLPLETLSLWGDRVVLLHDLFTLGESASPLGG